MPTTTDIIVDTAGGGDYSSMYDCAEDLVGTDLTALDAIYHVKCRGGSDSGGLTGYFRSITADDTRYLILDTDEGHRTDWRYPYVSGYNLAVTANAALIVESDYAKVRNLALNQIATGGWPSCLYLNANHIEVENVMAVSSGAAAETYAILANKATALTLKMQNVIAFSKASGLQLAFRALSLGATHHYFFNNCAFLTSNYVCFQRTGSGYEFVCKNCLFHGSPDDGDIHGSFSAGSTNNAYFHGSAPGTGANWQDYTRFGQLADGPLGANADQLFVDVAGDFRFANGVVGPDGVDLATDANFPVTTDITGAARNGNYWIGAFNPASKMRRRRKRPHRIRRRRTALSWR